MKNPTDQPSPTNTEPEQPEIVITEEQYTSLENDKYDPKAIQQMFREQYPGLEAFDSETICANVRLFIKSILKKSPVPFTQEVTREAIKYILKESVNERVEFNKNIRWGYVQAHKFDNSEDYLEFLNGGEDYGRRLFRRHHNIPPEISITESHSP